MTILQGEATKTTEKHRKATSPKRNSGGSLEGMSFPRTNIIDEQKDIDLNKEIEALNNLRKTRHSGWKKEGKNIDFN